MFRTLYKWLISTKSRYKIHLNVSFYKKKLGYIYATFIGKKNILLNECYYSN